MADSKTKMEGRTPSSSYSTRSIIRMQVEDVGKTVWAGYLVTWEDTTTIISTTTKGSSTYLRMFKMSLLDAT